MQKTDLFIIAAGKGSRMNINIPKALVPISDGEPNLTTMLKQIGHKFRTVFIVTNENIQDQWMQYFNFSKDQDLFKNVVNVAITSGLGDGHAVMMGLNESDKILTTMQMERADDVVVCWGDVFIQYGETVDELLAHHLEVSTSAGIMPAVKEVNPYVTLLVDDALKCRSADFSKYGENHPSGFHDQSIFRFKRNHLIDSLVSLHCSLWKNGRYMTQGGELSLLYTFHYLYNFGRGVKVYETDYPTLSFNTLDEVQSIQKEINLKWKNNQS